MVFKEIRCVAASLTHIRYSNQQHVRIWVVHERWHFHGKYALMLSMHIYLPPQRSTSLHLRHRDSSEVESSCSQAKGGGGFPLQ